jgi:hypothetical protein
MKQKKRPALVYCHGGFAMDTNELFDMEPFLNGDYIVM